MKSKMTQYMKFGMLVTSENIKDVAADESQ